MGANIPIAEANDIINDNPEISAYLEATIGIQSNRLKARLIVQGVTNALTLSTKPDSYMKDICTIIRKQGGSTSYGLTYQVEEKLIQFLRWCRYATLAQRDLDLANATEDGIQVLSEWLEQLPSSEEAEMPDKFTDQYKVRNLLENINSYLGIVKNKAGVPILYVIREDPNLPADDPGFGLPDFHTELATRGRHNGVYWKSSNRMVWTMMRHICHGTNAWPFVSSFERTANGRGAYLAFSQHYMGTDIQHGIRTKAADVLQNSRYTGESKNFTFDKFTARMTKAFNDSRYMPDEDKVIKLLNAFQVPSLDWAKGTISSNPVYRNNYDAAVAFLAEQVRAKKPSGGRDARDNRNISAFGGKDPNKTPNKKNNKGKWKFDPKNPTRYCPPHIYHKLDKDIKDKIRAAREKNKGGSSMKTQMASLMSNSEKQSSQISALTQGMKEIKEALPP